MNYFYFELYVHVYIKAFPQNPWNPLHLDTFWDSLNLQYYMALSQAIPPNPWIPSYLGLFRDGLNFQFQMAVGHLVTYSTYHRF